tara:strand:+ start:305 stop:649 length:345 start_codon:yes stop_codon:yes gene_type:complete
MIEECIVNYVCTHFELTRKQLRGKSRKSHIVDARQSCALAFREIGKTYKFIANVINRKDHTTIMHLVKRRSYNWHENERIAHEAVKAYKHMALSKVTHKKINMGEFLEMVQQIN